MLIYCVLTQFDDDGDDNVEVQQMPYFQLG